MDIRKKYGIVLRKFRQQTKMSQETFALSIDMDRTYVASVEQGKRNISLLNMVKIADGLNIPLSQFFAEMEKLGDDVKLS